MKVKFKPIFFILVIVTQNQCCPLCIGKLEKNSPAFFSDEFNAAIDADIANASTTPVQASITQEQSKEAVSCIVQK